MYTAIELHDTIVAPATAPGQSAIAMIRLSGPDAIKWTEELMGRKTLQKGASHKAHFSKIYRADASLIDEVVITVYKGPHSYTRQDVVEISCHGSDFIVREILTEFYDKGARPAEGGEFTMRSYLNGRMDLSQAEAVADLIAAESQKAHEIAIRQLRGGFSTEIQSLRERLIEFASLIELELDFGEEDVSFADRSTLQQTVEEIQTIISRLIDSFRMGNAIKNGISTVIAGRPNAGKSTFLNALLNEERAIVSAIEGTTRDTIEELIHIQGVQFRLIDTAGLREAGDQIEAIGIARTYEKIAQAAVLVFIFDANHTTPDQLQSDLSPFVEQSYSLIVVANKMDAASADWTKEAYSDHLPKGTPFLLLSAREREGLEEVKDALLSCEAIQGMNQQQAIVNNSRHYEALQRAAEGLARVKEGLEGGISSDFIAMDIRQALYHLGSIIGKVDVDKDILGTIFGKFCIGK